jgi:hypothetical protein
VTNGTEPVTDCGDARCGPCDDGDACTANAQCGSQRCVGGSCAPAAACDDGLSNGGESDVDCGGNNACARCLDGRACGQNADCRSGQCRAGLCACGDGQQNGDETAVDCGGSCGLCGAGLSCAVDADCTSGACSDGRCCGGSGVDCTRCAARLSPDRTCSGAFDDTGRRFCAEFLSCLAANPGACPTRSTPGCIDDPGGVCNHNTFGGLAGTGLTQADAILFSAGCAQ